MFFLQGNTERAMRPSRISCPAGRDAPMGQDLSVPKEACARLRHLGAPCFAQFAGRDVARRRRKTLSMGSREGGQVAPMVRLFVFSGTNTRSPSPAAGGTRRQMTASARTREWYANFTLCFIGCQGFFLPGNYLIRVRILLG
jgi:hypothetical protein